MSRSIELRSLKGSSVDTAPSLSPFRVQHPFDRRWRPEEVLDDYGPVRGGDEAGDNGKRNSKYCKVLGSFHFVSSSSRNNSRLNGLAGSISLADRHIVGLVNNPPRPITAHSPVASSNIVSFIAASGVHGSPLSHI